MHDSTPVSPSLNPRACRASGGLVAVDADHELRRDYARGKHALWKVVAVLERLAVALDVFLNRQHGHCQRAGECGQGDIPAGDLAGKLGREAVRHGGSKAVRATELKFLRVCADESVREQCDLPAEIFQQSLAADIVSINGRVVKNLNSVVGGRA